MKNIIYLSLTSLALLLNETAAARVPTPPETFKDQMSQFYKAPAINHQGRYAGLIINEKDDGREPIRWKPKEKPPFPSAVMDIQFLPAQKQAELEKLQTMVNENGGLDTLILGPALAAYLAAGMPDVAESQALAHRNPETGHVGDPAPFHKYGVGYRKSPTRRLNFQGALRKAKLVGDMVALNREVNLMVNRSKQKQRSYTDVRILFPSLTPSSVPMPQKWMQQLPTRPWVHARQNLFSTLKTATQVKPAYNISDQERLWFKRQKAWNGLNRSL